MKLFLFQTLFFIVLAESAGIVLNMFFLREPLIEVLMEGLIAGMSSSIIYHYFVKGYKRRQEKPAKQSVKH
ncbi:hypothetical protein [Mucilaginibacter sp.]